MARDEILRSTPDEDDLELEGPPCDAASALGDPTSDPVASLRPRTLDEFVGQTELKRRLGVILEAARRRKQAADAEGSAAPPARSVDRGAGAPDARRLDRCGAGRADRFAGYRDAGARLPQLIDVGRWPGAEHARDRDWHAHRGGHVHSRVWQFDVVFLSPPDGEIGECACFTERLI